MGRGAFLAMLIVAVSSSHAIVIRHDKNDQLYRDLGAQARYAPVGIIEYQLENGSGSGTANYIGVGTGGKKWIVTAGHVVDNDDWTSAKFTVAGRSYTIELSSRAWWTSHAPGVNDIGVARILDPDNTLDITPAKFWHNTVGIPANLGDRLIGTTVGFGQTGTGNTGPNSSDKVKRGMQNRVDAFRPKYNNGQSTLEGYSVDFDKNDAEHNNLDRTDFPAANFEAGQKSAREWLDLEGGGGDGDSGGGLFVDLDGQHVMIGIASTITLLRPGQTEGGYGSYTRYSPFDRTWALRVKEWTGIGPVPEPATLLVVAAGLGLAVRRRPRLAAALVRPHAGGSPQRGGMAKPRVATRNEEHPG